MTVDATQIAPGLYQGSFPFPGDGVRHAGFDVLVLAAEELQTPAAVYPGVEVLHVPLDDGKFREGDKKKAGAAARQVARAVRRGRRVLVTCAMGRNRSGLVVALVLRLLYPSMSPDEVIARIKERRPNAMTNRWFVESLRNEISSVERGTRP